MEDNLKIISIKVNKMYIVYLTLNTVNRKIYVGVHKTKDPEMFDGYIGCGVNINQPSSNKFPKTIFQKAVKKYGFKAFKRITLFVYDTEQEAYDMEAFIVNEKFLLRKSVYNMKLGGIIAPDCSKPIYRYDLNGFYLNGWPSIDTAANELGCSGMSISFAHTHKSISFNSLWATKKVEKLDITDYTTVPQDKPIYRYDKHGKYLTYYRNASEAAKELQCSREHVRDSVNRMGLCKGYYVSFEKLDKFIVKEKIKRSAEDEIHQYNLKGVYIKTFRNCKDASKQLGISLKSLQSKMAVNKSYKGFQWSYDKKDSLDNIEKGVLSSTPRKIDQYTLEGIFVKTWETYSECRKEFPNVGKVLRGITKKCKGFTFKYNN